MSNEVLNYMEWTEFKEWDKWICMGDNKDKITKDEFEFFLELVIATCIKKIPCNRDKFVNIFKEKNTEFYSLKDKVFAIYNPCSVNNSPFIVLKKLLRVPSKINFSEFLK